MTTRCVCIHCHFYQPPREDPWTREVPVEPSARPYPDWNEKVCAECYKPFSDARILGADGLVRDIVNLYGHVSFNAGPTLLAWLETAHPGVYTAMVQGDLDAAARYDGHGTALAMPFYHLILPLCRPRDRRTVVRWGIEDFRARFSREPEGMWLPETAVDIPTLEAVADEGIRFTILGPGQAARVRTPGGPWEEITPADLDTTVPYLCRLPSGKAIAVFFYDGAIASEIAFGNLLKDGKNLAERLVRPLFSRVTGPAVVNVAVDGETFGHHKAFGEMALAYAVQSIRDGGYADIVTYGGFLARYPPTREVEIIPGSSWSCAHGLCRWKGGCDCATDGRVSWSVEWRKPLRDALDQLSDSLASYCTTEISRIDPDPEGFILAAGLFVSRPSAREARALLERRGIPAGPEGMRALALLAVMRHTLAMYSSDAWFFDDIGRLEPAYSLRNAAKALGIARDLGGPALSPLFVSLLSRVKGNTPEYPDGKAVWERLVEPCFRTLQDVALHYALCAVLSEGEAIPSPGFTVRTRLLVRRRGELGSVIGAGTVTLLDDYTLEEVSALFAARAGPVSGCRIIGGPVPPGPRAEALAGDLVSDIEKGTVPGNSEYREMTLTPGETALFRRVVTERLAVSLWSRATEMDFLFRDLQVSGIHDGTPGVIMELCSLNLAGRVLGVSASVPADPEGMDLLSEKTGTRKPDLDTPFVRRIAGELVTRRARAVRDHPGNPELSGSLVALLDTISLFGIHPSLREAQDILFPLKGTLPPAGDAVSDTGEIQETAVSQLLQRLGIHPRGDEPR